jgi:hypothetical protein
VVFADHFDGFTFEVYRGVAHSRNPVISGGIALVSRAQRSAAIWISKRVRRGIRVEMHLPVALVKVPHPAIICTENGVV